MGMATWVCGLKPFQKLTASSVRIGIVPALELRREVFERVWAPAFPRYRRLRPRNRTNIAFLPRMPQPGEEQLKLLGAQFQ